MIATATHTQTRITRLVDVISATPERVTVSWTLGQRVDFDAVSRRGIGNVKDWWITMPLTGADLLSQGAMKLRAWLKSQAVTQRAFAGLIGTEVKAVNQWLGGDMSPGNQARSRIAIATNGHVNISDWDA